MQSTWLFNLSIKMVDSQSNVQSESSCTILRLILTTESSVEARMTLDSRSDPSLADKNLIRPSTALRTADFSADPLRSIDSINAKIGNESDSICDLIRLFFNWNWGKISLQSASKSTLPLPNAIASMGIDLSTWNDEKSTT